MSELRFVRIRGRIVPIRKKKQKETAQAAAYAGSGSAIAVGGSVFAGKQFKKARDLRRQGFFGARNIVSSNSVMPTLKDFRLKKSNGKIQGMGGNAKSIKGQIDMFDNAAENAARSFSRSKNLKAYKAAFRSKSFMKGTRWASSALVGLGVEKAISASGLEDKSFLGSFTSESTGVISAGLVHSISSNVFNKTAKGIPLRKGFSSDALKGIKKLSKILVRKKIRI